MSETKLPQTIIGSILTWILTFATWFATHLGVIVGIAAIIASAFTAMAGWETYLYRKAQRKRMEKDDL